MNTSSLNNPQPVGRDGARFLLAEAGDIAAGELNGPAQVHDTRAGAFTKVQPLQVWFKWNTYEDTTEEEYRAALEAAG